jgi:hypothetical protein
MSAQTVKGGDLCGGIAAGEDNRIIIDKSYDAAGNQEWPMTIKNKSRTFALLLFVWLLGVAFGWTE